MASQSSIPYHQHVDQESFTHSATRSGSSIPIVYVEGFTRIPWIIKLFGGYLNYSWVWWLCVSYHVLNVAFAAWTFDPSILANHTKKSKIFCWEFVTTLFIIQVQAFTLYLIAYRKLNSNQYTIDNSLERRFKIPCCSWITPLIMIPFLVCIVSAIVTWAEFKDLYDAIRYWPQLIFFIFDMFKWGQAIIMILIIYGYLNTLSDALENFKQNLE